MASIYKPTGRKHYHTTFYVPTDDGEIRKITKTTGKTNRSEAQRAAVELQALALAEAGAGEEKGRKILSMITRATEDAQKGILNATKGREYICNIVKIATGKDLIVYTIQEWIDKWMALHKGASEATIRAYTTYTRQFSDWLGDRANGMLQSLTEDDMEDLQEWYQQGAGTGRNVSANTANQKMKVISSVFIAAKKKGITNFNPAAAISPLDEDDSLQRKPFTQEEVSKLIEHSTSEDWKGLILMGAFTGLRLSDCATLKWSCITLTEDKKEIVTIPKKTRRKKDNKVHIPIHPTLEAFLEKLPIPINPDTPVFQSLASQTGTGRNGLSMQFTAIMTKAKVSRGKSISTGSRTSYERSFHSLRHTLTSLLANSDVSPEVRMKILGHKSEDVHSLYTHLGEDILKKAMDGVPGL